MLVTDLRNDMNLMRLQTIPDLHKLVANLTSRITAFSAVLDKVDLAKCTSEVTSLTARINAVKTDVQAAQSIANVTEAHVDSMVPRVAQITTALGQLSSYNTTIWNSLQTWSAGYKISVANTVTQTIASTIVTSTLTVTVGPGHRFSSLPDAISWASGQALLAPLTIQIADGTYSMQPFAFRDLPQPHLITIRGNEAAPGNVNFVATCSSGNFWYTYPTGTDGLTITGITLSNTNGQCVGIRMDSSVNIGVLVVTGFDTCFAVDGKSATLLTSLTVSYCTYGVAVQWGASFVSLPGVSVSVAHTTLAVWLAMSSSYAILGTTTISNSVTGVQCDSIGSAFAANMIWGSNVGTQFSCPVHFP